MRSAIADAEYVAPVSVVIATLGTESLWRTVEHLNSGTRIPREILICIPEENAHTVEGLVLKNVRIVQTRFRGQVAQRAAGFRLATCPFVLQLDDDIQVSETCLSALLTEVAASAHVAAGPKWYDVHTGKYHSFLVPDAASPTRFQRLLYWVINGRRGFQAGVIGKAGVNMGMPETPGTWEGVDWLAGGCLMHRRENLILGDFYPFTGKAWAEDLFHSRLLKAKGVKLVRCGAAACYVNFSSSSFAGVARLLRDHIEYSRRMTVLVRESGGSVIRLYGYLILSLVGIAARRVRAGRR